MTKEILVDLVKKRLGDEVHSRLIEEAIGRAWNQLLYDTFKYNPDDLDLYVKQYEAAVSTDATTSLKYSSLPAVIVQLPNGEHIRRISPKEDETNVFDPVSIQQRSILNNLTVANISERPTTYTIRGDKVEYEDISSAVQSAGVLMDLVVAFEEYADTDDIYLPSGQDEVLVETTVRFLQGTPPDNGLDNNTKEQT